MPAAIVVVDVSIVVATYGDASWRSLARSRALPSARDQGPGVEVVEVHRDALHEARNDGAAIARGEWLVFLDADDEVGPGYAAAILRAAEQSGADLIQPATLAIDDGVPDGVPACMPEVDLRTGNYLVVGTAIRKAMFDDVGGFWDWPMYEDWDLWLRCHFVGATVAQAPGAVYRWWRNLDGRNTATVDERRAAYAAIRKRHARAIQRWTRQRRLRRSK